MPSLFEQKLRKRKISSFTDPESTFGQMLLRNFDKVFSNGFHLRRSMQYRKEAEKQERQQNQGLLHQSYDKNKAPCICVEGKNQHTAEHGLIHTQTNILTAKYIEEEKKFIFETTETSYKKYPHLQTRWTLSEAAEIGAQAVEKVGIMCKQCIQCDKACIKAQVLQGHEKMGGGLNGDSEIKPTVSGYNSFEHQKDVKKKVENNNKYYF